LREVHGELAIRNSEFGDGNAGNEDGNADLDNTKTPEDRQRRSCSVEKSAVQCGSDMLLALIGAEER
jgi:hypothetical protein